jgi:hypothetical protein
MPVVHNPCIPAVKVTINMATAMNNQLYLKGIYDMYDIAILLAFIVMLAAPVIAATIHKDKSQDDV